MTVTVQIPEEIKAAIKALDHEHTWLLLSILGPHGRMQYPVLKSRAGLTKQEFREAVKRLQIGGLLEQKAEVRYLGQFEKSWYSVSPFGNSLLDGIWDSLRPRGAWG